MIDLVVATFNIRNGRALDGRNSWPFRRAATVDTIRQLDADVLGLQEVHGFQLRLLRRRLPDFCLVGEGRSARGRNERCPLVVRRAILDVVEWRTRWYGEERGGRLAGATFPRIATVARLRHRSTGVELDVVNTHLDEHSPENRERSAAELTSWLSAARPTVVVGDFNSAEDDVPLAILRESGLLPVLATGAPGTSHGFSGRVDGPRIDHILVSGHWQAGHAEVMTSSAARLSSDHWPVVATLRIRCAG